MPVVVCKHKHMSKWEKSGDVFLVVHCAGVLGAASHAGRRIGAEGEAISLPWVTLDSWIWGQKAGTEGSPSDTGREEHPRLAQTFCKTSRAFRQRTWQEGEDIY